MAQILVTGASGFLGHRIARHLRGEGHEVFASYHRNRERCPQDAGIEPVELDLVDESSIERAFRAAWPEVVIHAAAMSELKTCEVDPAAAERVNVASTRKLAKLSAALGARMLLLSTDQVFDGSAGRYKESDVAKPLHVYGRSKLDAELTLQRHHPGATVLRISLVYGDSPSGDRSASEKVVNALRAGDPVRLFTDEVRSPVYAEDVAIVCSALMRQRDARVVHVAGPERLSRHEFGLAVARAYDLDVAAIEAVELKQLDLTPPRPMDVSLDTKRLRTMVASPPRTLEAALAELVRRSPLRPSAGPG